MKAENPQAQWEDIFAATTGFKNKHEVKGRYKELMEKEKTGEKENSKGAAAGNKEDNGDDKDAKRARKKEEGLRKQAEAKAKREAEQNAKSKEAGEDGKNEKNDKKVSKCLTTFRYSSLILYRARITSLNASGTTNTRDLKATKAHSKHGLMIMTRRNGKYWHRSIMTGRGSVSLPPRLARWPKGSKYLAMLWHQFGEVVGWDRIARSIQRERV